MPTIIQPTLDQALAFAASGKYDIIPLRMEIYADLITPIQLLRKLKSAHEHVFLLESAEDTKQWGRYTFLGFAPKLSLSCLDGKVTIVSPEGRKVYCNANPNPFIQELLDSHKAPKMEGFPPFAGGLIGYFAYDYAKYVEPKLNLTADCAEDFQDVDLMLFDQVIAIDNFRQKISLIVNIPCKKAAMMDIEYEKGIYQLEYIKNLIEKEMPIKDFQGLLMSDFRPLFSADAYISMVDTAKNHIYEGDIFQVVLSNRLEADFKGDMLDVYRSLRCINPSPYMFYFSGSDLEIAGASPETLVKLENGTLTTYPLAGTRPRGETSAEDEALEADLRADEKELAEHNMLVDLGRNDLGKISQIGSVHVQDYQSILRFSHVMHIGSTVVGQIDPKYNALDAINAVLPAGTLSGAPKIRAMEIINELENNKRGIYGGAIGYLDFTGNMDTCIAIRIAYKKGDKIYIRSGAGIVADSIPENEYQECFNKAKAMKHAILASQS